MKNNTITVLQMANKHYTDYPAPVAPAPGPGHLFHPIPRLSEVDKKIKATLLLTIGQLYNDGEVQWQISTAQHLFGSSSKLD